MDLSAFLKNEKNVPSSSSLKDVLAVDNGVFASLSKEQALDRYVLLKKLGQSLQIRVLFSGMVKGKVFVGLNPDQMNSLFGNDKLIDLENLEEAKNEGKSGFFAYGLSKALADHFGIGGVVSLDHPEDQASLRPDIRDFISRSKDGLVREFLTCAYLLRSKEGKE